MTGSEHSEYDVEPSRSAIRVSEHDSVQNATFVLTIAPEFGRVRYVPLQTGRYEAGFEQCYAFWRPLLVITYFTAPQPARTASKSACADDPPIVSNGSCQDLRRFQPLSCRHGIVDPVISPKQNGFLEDEGGHLPDFSIGTRAEPVPEGSDINRNARPTSSERTQMARGGARRQDPLTHGYSGRDWWAV